MQGEEKTDYTWQEKSSSNGIEPFDLFAEGEGFDWGLVRDVEEEG